MTDIKTVDGLETAKRLTLEMLGAQVRVKAAEDELKAATAALADVQENRLPKLMEELELPEFTTTLADGARVKVSCDEVIRVSIPAGKGKGSKANADNRPAAYNFFRSIGQGGVIKKEMAANLGIRGDNVVCDMVAKFSELFPGVDVAVTEKIEPATVTAVIKKRLISGESVPLDIFTVFRQMQAKADVS